MIEIIGHEADGLLDWTDLIQAMAAGHELPRAEVRDSFIYRKKDTLLSRAAWIDGLGIATKAATIFPGNPADGKPMVGGAVSLFPTPMAHLRRFLIFIS